jgi:hypothetical protein
LQEDVGRPVRLQNQQPGNRGDHLGEHVRCENDHPQRGLAPQLAIDQQSQAEAERQLNYQREQDEQPIVPDCAEKHRIRQRPLVVVQANEIVQLFQAVPFKTAVKQRHYHRNDDESEIEQDCRDEEQADLQSLSTGGAPSPAAPGQRSGCRGGEGRGGGH